MNKKSKKPIINKKLIVRIEKLIGGLIISDAKSYCNYIEKLQNNLGLKLDEDCENKILYALYCYEKYEELNKDFSLKIIKDLIENIGKLRKQRGAYNKSKIAYKKKIILDLYNQEFFQLLQIKNVLFGWD